MREMKDSGVEWIGKIPKDWEIVPLTKQLDSIVDYRGKTPEKTEEGTFLVTAKNIKDGKICYELSKEYVREADYEEIMHRGIPQIGDILFTTEAPLGQVANVDRTDIALAQRIIKFRALSTVNNYYLKYWMLNEGFQQFLHSLSTGSTATGIKSSKLFLLPLVRPNIEQQNKIVEYLEDYLTHHGGYTKGDPKKFNRESGLEEDTFVEFIKTSQPKKWERYVKIYAENSEKQIIERFKREVKTTNLLNVMRHGFMDRGIKFYPIFWKPETSLNETTQMQYDANILHCTRQLHYSVHNENSIDIVLFANGIPVVSMELKCQFTGQDTTNAINQYKFDRAGKDAIFAFKERVLVHFAVDLTNVYMTTRLEGAHTYFLPFNQGSNGAGKVGGKGNPVNPNGYDTAYLWERVLCKDSLMEILQKYMHLQQEYDKNGNLVKETMIFPRYHQLDVVTKLLEDVKKNGSGKSYLIQHSAGSGKSNSIAWLAHRLTGLHDYEDNKIFQSVIIVTDRRVLDSQLQSTVYQFDLSLIHI